MRLSPQVYSKWIICTIDYCTCGFRRYCGLDELLFKKITRNYTIPLKIKKKVQKISDFLHFPGLSDKTWTCGLYHPKVARILNLRSFLWVSNDHEFINWPTFRATLIGDFRPKKAHTPCCVAFHVAQRVKLRSKKICIWHCSGITTWRARWSVNDKKSAS